MSEEQTWERQALQDLLNESLKDKKNERRWRTFWRIIWIILVGVIVFNLFNPFKGKSSVLGKHTAVVNLDGEISASTPANASSINASLKAAFDNPESVGVILKINSPGGSPVQAGIIHDEILRLRKLHPDKHLYVVVEELCASGGYYVAVAAEKIYVDKASLIGSIGVIMEGFGFNSLMEKLGVERRVIAAGENKGMMDPYTKQNPKHRESLQQMINTIHQQFIQVVKDGRGERLKNDPDLFTGMVWNGAKSIEVGLTDELGSVDYVAREVFKQPDLIDYSETDNIAERFAKKIGASIGGSFAQTIGHYSLH
ncbi:MAG: signal peptide peptidase SppA [Betaproteobacteria bacterium]